MFGAEALQGDRDSVFQVKRLTYSGERTLSALTQYITNYTVSPIHSSMQTGTEADAASIAIPNYLFLQEIAVVPPQNLDQLAFDLDQTVYTKAPKQVAHNVSLYVCSPRHCSMQCHKV